MVAPTLRPSPRTACCTSPPSGFEVSARTKSPAPLSRARSTAGFSEPSPVRRHRQRVREERRVLAQEGLRVRGHGRADVAALGVHHDQRPGRPRLLDRLLQDGDAPRADPLEERALRLEDRDPLGQRLDDGAAQPLQARDVVVQAPVGEQRGVRVDADAQRAALVHGNGEDVGFQA